MGTDDWPRRYDDWYEKFRQSEHYGEMSFARWCREVVRYCDGDPMSITANVVKEGHMANNIYRLSPSVLFNLSYILTYMSI